MTTIFRVVAVSRNTNAFGLHKFVFVAQTGEALAACGNKLRVDRYRTGDVLALDIDPSACLRNLTALGFELPVVLPRAPAAVVASVWPRVEIVLVRPSPSTGDMA